MSHSVRGPGSDCWRSTCVKIPLLLRRQAWPALERDRLDNRLNGNKASRLLVKLPPKSAPCRRSVILPFQSRIKKRAQNLKRRVKRKCRNLKAHTPSAKEFPLLIMNSDLIDSVPSVCSVIYSHISMDPLLNNVKLVKKQLYLTTCSNLSND